MFTHRSIISPVLTFLSALLAVNSVSALQLEEPSRSNAMLTEYRLAGTPVSITGLEDNASGITYSPHSNTLFMVVNNPEKIYELSLSGHMLRIIFLSGFDDTEGIAHIEGDRFVILEERRSTLSLVNIA